MEQPPRILTVSQLTGDLKEVLEGVFGDVIVEGEVSNVRQPSSGHVYFSLKDAHAQLRCVLFRGAAAKIRIGLADGMQVICHGRLGIYERDGQYQLYVNAVEPKGVGALALAFERLKDRLAKEGLFEVARKKRLPAFPRVIGIVTSPTGAVIRDILQILNRRFPRVHVIVNPVRVQGEGAGEEIARAIADFNALAEIDVIILARGGGSLEDLWAFNEEMVARAIAASNIPVVSAVGHETDFTIADFVADLRAPTPSAAAELVVPSRQELVERIQDLSQQLERWLSQLIPQYAQHLDDLRSSLERAITLGLEQQEISIRSLRQQLQMLNPSAILSRGYSITFSDRDGRVLVRAEDAAQGDCIRTRLSEGELISKVISEGRVGR